MAQTQYRKKIKIIRSSNALELVDGNATIFFEILGVIHQTSYSDRRQQNGRAERRDRNIFEMARSLRFHAILPLQLWGECVLTTTHITNRIPNVVHERKSPYEVPYGMTPDYKHLNLDV